jgi:hypothetical protein
MNIRPPEQTELERFLYWQGQTLRSRDFRDQDAVIAQLRWWHNRSLHSAFGLSFGLEVSAATVDGVAVVRVTCGAAYDCFGRELVVRQGGDVPLPPGPEANERMVLVLSYRSTGAEFRWMDSFEWRPSSGVPMYAIRGEAGAWKREALRTPIARPIARPRIASGETVRGNTPWEPWVIEVRAAEGGSAQKVLAGVQTRIDTSAAGFTETPVYYAALYGPEWDLKTSTFAPAFFANIADAGIDGFTFRLLMLGIARRSYPLKFGISRVTELDRRQDERLIVTVENAADFKKGDAVSLVRPRGDTYAMIASANNDQIVLSAPLAVVKDGTLTIGNLPRVSRVTKTQVDETMVLAVEGGTDLRRGVVLARFAEEERPAVASVITQVRQQTVTLQQPLADLKPDDVLHAAVAKGAFTARKAALSADGARLEVTVDQADKLHKGDIVLRLPTTKRSASAPSMVMTASGDQATLAPPIPDGIEAGEKLAVVSTQPITVTEVVRTGGGVKVTVDDPKIFAIGDIVGGINPATNPTVVEGIAGKVLDLRDPIPLQVNTLIAAANLLGATAVESVFPDRPTFARVSRPQAIKAGHALSRIEEDEFGTPVVVNAILGDEVKLSAAIEDLARGDTLVVAELPTVATVTAIDSAQQVRVTPATSLRGGDFVAVSGTGGQIVEVATASGNTVILRDPIDSIAIGDTLVSVNFRDTAVIVDVTAGPGGPTLKLDRAIETRPGDLAAPFTSYADNSRFAIVDTDPDTVKNALVLRDGTGQVLAGEGVVVRDIIDGGILGPAALTPAQSTLRLESHEGLGFGTEVTVSGREAVAGDFRAIPMRVIDLDPALHRVRLDPTQAFVVYQYRPEAMSITQSFNASFPAVFASFAQKKNLSVCWMGCQVEGAQVPDCATAEDDPCADASAAPNQERF